MVSLTDERIRWTSCTNGRRTYTGKTPDGVGGLYYYRHRYYAAELGRFLTRDPIGYEDSDNLFQYVSARPALLTDPSGEGIFTPVHWVICVFRLNQWLDKINAEYEAACKDKECLGVADPEYYLKCRMRANEARKKGLKGAHAAFKACMKAATGTPSPSPTK
jgi:RHS repeat-associated protein